MITSVINGYLETLRNYDKLFDFLERQEILGIQRLDSLWRKENLLLKIDCSEKNYVFKKINNHDKANEVEKFQTMREEYPGLMPEIYFWGKDYYLMDWIDGNSFFNLDESERVEKIRFAGVCLRKAYDMENKEKLQVKDISDKVRGSFERYRKKRERFFEDNELRLDFKYFEIFKRVPSTLSHNDLNAANLLYTSENIKLIDPSDEGFSDIARDVGRYCASCFFNNYDYFGNDKEESLRIACALLSCFDDETKERAKYFAGESFLSFLNFDTVSVDKRILKKITIDVLTKKGGIAEILNESL